MTKPTRSHHHGVRPQQVEAVMHLKTLLLRARLIVDGFLSGVHRSPYFGFSAEFAEYRQYVPGDDVRYVDWKRYGRSDRLQIKRFEDETNLRAVLMVDASGSMAFASGGWSKYEYAATLAASLALLFEHQRDAVGAVLFDSGVRTWLPPRRGRRHCRHVLAELEQGQPGGRTDLQTLFEWLSGHVRRRSVLVVLSDFLGCNDRDLAALPYISAAGLDVLVFHIADPQEVAFSYRDPTWVTDAETGERLLLDPHAVRDTYRLRFQRHREAVADACRAAAIEYHFVTTDQPLELALIEVYRRRARLKRQGRLHRRAAH